ncbi:ferrous iron transport protein B [Terrilactibacillus laevilacticus]|uniref:ferrous iron transport protein B n=1 Tax=Terrilactibacillus laevilacticus TaxID=1380157 RepID=UPI0011475372|nr:ferrous iron transport protein B [Terrilactibacillus laevilacticus]
MEVALLGNPNTGKTSLFNELTGSYEYVGNWTGVTVDKKVGTLKKQIGQLIDLPGVYALNPISKDEGIASQYLLENRCTSTLNIVDASGLSRNLHLTIQLLEFGKPLVIGLNMVDVAKSRGIAIDVHQLSEELNVPVLPIIARTGKGCRDILDYFSLENQHVSHFSIDYGEKIEKAIENISDLLHEEQLNHRWLALQLLQGNQIVLDHIKTNKGIDLERIQRIIQELDKQIEEVEKCSLARAIYSKRKQIINDILEKVITKEKNSDRTFTDIIDSIVTNKFLGIPIFLSIMYFIFHMTFNWIGTPVSDWLDGFFSGSLSEWIGQGLQAVHATPFIRALILNGLIAGVGGVIVFVPQMIVLFFFISLIEDSGYMARVALVMDRIMQVAGLNGKSFIPLVIGFGCNIPGIMASRSIEQPKERLITVLITPLMSCSARLAVYSLFAGAFFAEYQALVVLSLYVLGVILALVMAKVFSFFLKHEHSVFIVELPPYRVPNAKTLFISTWDKSKGFVKKATTFILGGTVVIWLLSYAGPHGLNVNIDQSFLALVCGYIAPLVAPLGFGTWQAGTALVSGFLAKEAVVSTMSIVYHAPHSGTLTGVISQAFTPLQAYTFMVFSLLYIPCLSTVPAIYKEVGTRKLTWFTVMYCVALAYIVSLVIYQVGRLMGF